MASAIRNHKEAPPNMYEQQRLANIAANKRRLDALNLPTLKNMLPHDQNKKRVKRTHSPSDAQAEGHNLRARPQRNCSENANEQIEGHNLRTRPQRNLSVNANELIGADNSCESMGDFLCDNEDFHSPQKKRKGRGITKLDDIFAREPSMPKIKIMLNAFGQPIGDNSRKFSSAIGCHVRRKLSVKSVDWRLVDPEQKYAVWTDLKQIYDIDEAAFGWFLTTAGRKWKDFKATLKEQYFDDSLTEVELKERHSGRVNDDDWKFLIDYWMSSESQVQTKRAKFSRSQVEIHHTSGSKSFARSGHEMAKELGRPPRRDELYIKTHTRKNGAPTRHAEPIINKLKETIEAHPELMQRTIQQGDAFAAACGEKEPRGRVRVLGLGPTPQDVRAPGLKSYTPTRMQMEVLARKKVELEKAALEKRIAEMEKEMEEQRRACEVRNVEMVSQNGSNTRHHLGPRSGECVDEANNIAQFHEHETYEEDQNSDEGENILVNRRASSPVVQSCEDNPISVAPAVQLSHVNHIRATPIVQPHQANPISAAPAMTSIHDELIGKDEILYAMRRCDQPVAKGTIISTNPNTMLGGVSLGKQCCEVVVNVVLKRDAELPRPYGYVERMGDADRLSIAWPYSRLKVSKTSKSS